jgi:glycosyltransferase involved in cell wall biosynthesis
MTPLHDGPDRLNRVLAFFIQDLREGGAERTTVRLLNGIVGLGLPADLVVIERKGGFFDELDSRVNVVELPQSRTLTSVVGLKHYIERRRPVALVSALAHTNVAAIVANEIARPKTRLVVVEHNQLSMNRLHKSGLVRTAYRLIPWAYRRADLVAAVSAGVRDDLSAETGIPTNRIAVLYNPVVTPALQELAAVPVDHPWLRDPGPPVVLGVGRFSEQKNFRLLLVAFAKVRRTRRLRLIILGEGKLRPELEALIRALNIGDDVDLPGFDPNPFRFMSRAAVYVLSSDWEGLPTALIEALACGASVVATDCLGGIDEILDGGRFGRIVPRRDADALATGIAATLDAPTGSRNARIAHTKRFGLESAVRRYLEAAGLSNDDSPP